MVLSFLTRSSACTKQLLRGYRFLDWSRWEHRSQGTCRFYLLIYSLSPFWRPYDAKDFLPGVASLSLITPRVRSRPLQYHQSWPYLHETKIRFHWEAFNFFFTSTFCRQIRQKPSNRSKWCTCQLWTEQVMHLWIVMHVPAPLPAFLLLNSSSPLIIWNSETK